MQRPYSVARLALPRRVYGQAHLDHVVDTMPDVLENAGRAPAHRLLSAPRVLAHFFARYAPAVSS